MNVEPIHPKWIPEVARIHRQELPDDFCSLLGQKFLESLFYPYFFAQPDNFGFVALEQNRVLGFVIAGPPEGYYGRLVKEHFIEMCWFGAKSLIRKPWILLYAVMVARVLLSRKTYQFGANEIELLYIAVTGKAQGKSIGRKLVARLMQHLDPLEYQECVVKTLEVTPLTNAFYEKNGFQLKLSALGRNWYGRACGPSAQEQETSRQNAA